MGILFKRGVSTVLSGLLCYGAWWLWNEIPRLLRRTEFSDFSFVASLLAVVLVLSILDPLLAWGWGKIDREDPSSETG